MDDLSRRQITINYTLWRKNKMRELERVRLTVDRPEYEKANVKAGDKGTVMLGERNGYVLVFFDDEFYTDENGCYMMYEKEVGVRIEDLEIIHDEYSMLD